MMKDIRYYIEKAKDHHALACIRNYDNPIRKLIVFFNRRLHK